MNLPKVVTPSWSVTTEDDTGGHVQGMKRSGSDLSVTACGRQNQVGKMRIVGSVD